MGRVLERTMSKSKIIILLFVLTIIFSQFFRESLNRLVGASIFNYNIVTIGIVFYMIFFTDIEIVKSRFLIYISILVLIIVAFLNYRYPLVDLIRTLISFYLPLLITCIDFKKMDVDYILKHIVKSLNYLIYISIGVAVVQYLFLDGFDRTGGIIGHPLTAGWYYCIFLGFNIIYCDIKNELSDLQKIAQIVVALVGTILAAGRMSMFGVIILAIVYIITTFKNKIRHLGASMILGSVLLCTEAANKLIWSKFAYAKAWGDITNGRLLGLRELEFFDVYPGLILGEGLGHSNYLTTYVFGTVNFENPLVMFAFDYGILGVILTLILICFIPMYKYILKRNYKYLIVHSILIVIPFMYNGISETIGLWEVLVLISMLILLVNTSITKNVKYRPKHSKKIF